MIIPFLLNYIPYLIAQIYWASFSLLFIVLKGILSWQSQGIYVLCPLLFAIAI